MTNTSRDRAGTIIEISIVALICLVFACRVASFARSASATFDETARLPAGYTYLRWHDYRLNPDHPPLLKKLAAIPLLWRNVWPDHLAPADSAPKSDHSGDWRQLPDSQSIIDNSWANSASQYYQQWIFGHCFLYGIRDSTLNRLRARNPEVVGPYSVPTSQLLARSDFYNNPDALLFSGRMTTMVLGVLLGILVYLWSRGLFGVPAAMLSILLFCFDPNFIAHSGLITTDVGVSVFMFGAMYFFWRICGQIRFVRLLLFLAFFAAAFMSKFSSVLLGPIFWCTAAIWLILTKWHDPRRLLNRLGWVACVFLLAIVTAGAGVWAAYDFRYLAIQNASGPAVLPIETLLYRQAAIVKELSDHPGEVSPAARPDFERRVAERTNERLLTTSGKILMFAMQHQILPEAYLYGLAHAEMDPTVRSSFLRGEYSSRSFRSFYAWTFLLKTPLPALLIILAAILTALFLPQVRTSNLAFILTPVAVYFLALSFFTNLNIGHRHLLPAYPFVYVFCGVVGIWWARWPNRCKWLIATAAVGAIVISSQFVFSPPNRPARVHPYYLAYFNELAGGPRNGVQNLVDSNLDWGQELKTLRAWLVSHKVYDPIWLSYFGTADPQWHQIRYYNAPKGLGGYLFRPPPPSPLPNEPNYFDQPEKLANEIRPGQFVVISATNLSGVYLGDQARAWWQSILGKCNYVDQIGYSLFIYQVAEARD